MKKYQLPLTACFALAVLAGCSNPSGGGGTGVTPLKEQIDALDDGTSASPAVLVLSGGTYPMTRDDAISLNNKHIHIKVPAGETATIQLTEALDAYSGLFYLHNNSTLILGEDSGGGTLIIDGGNQASPPVTGTGSLIYVSGTNSTVEIKNGVTLRNNTSTGSGGAIKIGGDASGRAVLTISGGTIRGNTAEYGGGISINAYTTLTMTGGVIEHNTATTDSGGGISSWNGSNVSIENSWPVIDISGGEIRNNQAAEHGGGVYSHAKFTLTAGTIHHNSVTGSGGVGGGIYREGSHANSSFSVPVSWTDNVYDNTADTGPQIHPAP
jgi:predicted outer membrane repeat protein